MSYEYTFKKGKAISNNEIDLILEFVKSLSTFYRFGNKKDFPQYNGTSILLRSIGATSYKSYEYNAALFFDSDRLQLSIFQDAGIRTDCNLPKEMNEK